jgi:SAM-dependent methyltransferase
MSEPFGAAYAAAYDALYADKDYDAECDLLEGIFKEWAKPVRAVLDLGCGTGAHAVRLAQRGYDVVGVDMSEAMLDAARRRANDAGSSRPTFVRGDIRTLRLDSTFDAVICMFAVLGYQTSDADVADALNTVRVHLRPAGSFTFDVWYGPAVEATGPSERVKVVQIPGGELERRASAVLDSNAHLCTVSYRLVSRKAGLADEVTNEVHRMRYFYKDELGQRLLSAGLSLESLTPFPDATAPLDAAAWNVLATAVG